MTLGQLFNRFRSEIDDLKTPYLWDDDDLESYLNWSLEELAKKTKYWLDQTTWEGLTVTADSAKITATSANKLDRILFIRRATLVSTGRQLGVLTMSQADSASYGNDYGRSFFDGSAAWETREGTPQIIITDYYEDGSLRLGPIPTVADTLNLWAYRLPVFTVDFESSQDIQTKELLGIKEHSHELTLIQGMKARAYLKEDPETRDDNLAALAATELGVQLDDIKHQLARRRHPVGTVRYGGI